ncbi:unnamed protein product [Clavelina lepadiformis]|uniref:Methyltransferase type 11 domain-containing protein n=1 Tax=Clavelina lepadiformis TaxID=159417 RepID=A0ABP0GZI8_CLALP
MIKLFEASQQTAAYANNRPKTPAVIGERIFKFMKDRGALFECVVDVGCGSGQSSEIFVGHFKNIIGVDTSPNQIEWAGKKNMFDNITYKLGSSDNLPVEDKSVDLVASGQAAHWFGFDSFITECRRVLKPNGCLLLHAYDLPRMAPVTLLSKSQENLMLIGKTLVKELYDKCTFHPCLFHISEHYATIFDLLPSADKVREDDMIIEADMNLESFKNLLRSWSGYQTYLEEKTKELWKIHGTDAAVEDHDILKKFVENCKRIWGLQDVDNDHIMLHVEWDLFCVMSSGLD